MIKRVFYGDFFYLEIVDDAFLHSDTRNMAEILGLFHQKDD